MAVPTSSERRDHPADLLLRGGNVVTVDAAFRRAEAVAIRDQRIVAVGRDAELSALVGPATRVVELRGRTVLPGIIDQHIHLDELSAALSGRILDLTVPFPSLAALVEATAEHGRRRPDDAWLVGAGWSETTVGDLGEGGRVASREQLDAAHPERPVFLWHFSMHAALVNAAALRAAGIDRDTPDPTGGRIVRDPASGEATGLLLESATELVEAHMPDPPRSVRAAEILSAMATLNRLGVTSVTDPRVTAEGLRDYAEVRRIGEPTVRVHCLLHWGASGTSNTSDEIARGLESSGVTSGFGDEWLAIAGGKVFADGVPSQRTAWVDDVYPGTDQTGGLVVAGEDDEARVADLHRCIRLLHEHRLQVQVHAIGDRAGDAVVDAFVAAQEADPWPDARPVLIHGVVLRPETIARLAEHRIGVSTNALIRYHHAGAMRPALGDERWDGTVAVRALLDAGVAVSDASDAPVVPADWRRGVQALVTRETAESDGRPVGPDQRIERDEALRAWTATAAYQQHAERDKGTIEPGKLADLVVLEEDPLTVDAARLHALTPVATFVGGRCVFDGAGLLEG